MSLSNPVKGDVFYKLDFYSNDTQGECPVHVIECEDCPNHSKCYAPPILFKVEEFTVSAIRRKRKSDPDSDNWRDVHLRYVFEGSILKTSSAMSLFKDKKTIYSGSKTGRTEKL